VQHIGSHPSILPSLLMREGPLPASHAADGERIEAGRIYVAPPDRHMLVDGDVIRLSRGPKEHHARPAIDPLFRSAAVSRGAQVIGVVLTGLLDDGTAGLQSIKSRGGTAVIQDPADAERPSMPASALRYVDVDHSVPLAAMGALLRSLAQKKTTRAAPATPQIVHENEIMLGKGDFMKHLEAIGEPSTFVCPDCAGALWKITGTEPARFRCHTGHAYTLRSLQHAQSEGTNEALWSALRALQEKELLLKALAAAPRADREAEESARLQDDAERTARHAEALRGLIETIPSPPE
jgi:two-component system chemotaxis response regulator CheB